MESLIFGFCHYINSNEVVNKQELFFYYGFLFKIFIFIFYRWFDCFIRPEFARSGFKASKTITLPEGPLMEFNSSMEPNFRKLGLPTEVKNGRVYLRQEHTVCTIGDILTPAQAQILKLIGESLAQFKITLKCVWSKDGSFELLYEENADQENQDVEMDEI